MIRADAFHCFPLTQATNRFMGGVGWQSLTKGGMVINILAYGKLD